MVYAVYVSGPMAYSTLSGEWQGHQAVIVWVSQLYSACLSLSVIHYVSGYKAWRHSGLGSWFVRTIVYVFSRYSHQEHLMDLLLRVSGSWCMLR